MKKLRIILEWDTLVDPSTKDIDEIELKLASAIRNLADGDDAILKSDNVLKIGAIETEY